MEEDKQKNLQALKEFFESDMKIKERLLMLAPSELDEYSEESRIEYIDKLYKNIEMFEETLLLSAEKLELGQEIDSSIKEHFEKLKESFLIGKYERGICRQVYDSKFSTMNKRFVEEVKDTCVGYKTRRSSDSVQLIDKAKTVNELLHVMHSYIVNNDDILQSMPIVGTKKNTIGETITLYGEENEVAQNIFEEFPLEMDCGSTDIISLKNKVLMMVRDRGHALTIDMDTSKQDGIDIKYFVPKLCNEDMIKKLPGINKSGITSNGATGFFVSSKDDIIGNLFDFIEKVPTDDDMFKSVEKIEEIKEIQEESITTNDKSDEKLKLELKEPIFKEEDAKEMTIQQGENGRKMSKIQIIQEKIRMAITKLREKFSSKETKER